MTAPQSPAGEEFPDSGRTADSGKSQDAAPPRPLVTPYYQDEFVRLYHGDCREVTAWLEADVLVTDPPYGIAYQTNRSGTAEWHAQPIAGDGDTALRDEVLARWGDRPALVFGSWRRPRPTATRAVLIYDKGGATGMGDLTIPWKPSHEEVYVLGREWGGTRDCGSVIQGRVQAMASNGRHHPTEKDWRTMVGLIAKCRPGTIADPFAGSGSTLVAAKQLGRKAIGVELDERYCEIAARRLSQDVLPFEDSA